MRHIILVSGKDSLATALLQTTLRPELPYEFLFNDVGCELPETYEWLDKVEQKTGWSITRIGESLLAKIRSYGGFLPGPRARYCTKECKIQPAEAFFGTDPCTVYYGLRADENRTGYVPFGKANITPVYPLRTAGVDLQGVYSILDAQDLMPPSFLWQRLRDAVCKELQFTWHGWQDKLTRGEHLILFAGRTRANCFFCFFQRQYEFLWLREVHPDLFEEASGLEKADYTFQPGFALRMLDDPAKREVIFQRRVKEVVNTIKGRFQGQLFDGYTDNELALTSCGLLCGK